MTCKITRGKIVCPAECIPEIPIYNWNGIDGGTKRKRNVVAETRITGRDHPVAAQLNGKIPANFLWSETGFLKSDTHQINTRPGKSVGRKWRRTTSGDGDGIVGPTVWITKIPFKVRRRTHTSSCLKIQSQTGAGITSDFYAGDGRRTTNNNLNRV